jgi:hypothetical protein
MATITWRSAVSGNWSDGGDWGGSIAPGSADTAEIGPGLSADAAWIVSASDQTVGSFDLDAGGFGMLSVSGSFAVTGTLSVASGTFLATASSEVSDGAFAMTGGTATLDGATQIDGAGDADIASGTVAVQDGGIWITDGIGIGTGLTGGESPGQGTVLLRDQGSGLGGGTLAVDGALVVGADAGTGSLGPDMPGGSGTLSVTDGSLAAAQSLAILNHSTVSVDATGAVAIGNAIPSPGGVSVGSNATLVVDIGNIDGGLGSNGGVTVGELLSGVITAPGNLAVSGTFYNAGSLDVNSTSTLAVGGDLYAGTFEAGVGARVNVAGTLYVDGTLTAQSSTITSDVMSMTGGTMVLDGGTMSSTGFYGASLFGGNAVLDDGGTWLASRLAIGVAYGSLVDTASVLLRAGSGGAGGVLAVTGLLTIGGAAGTLTVDGDSRVTAAGLDLMSPQYGSQSSSLSVDGSSSVVLGDATAVAGAVAIGDGATLSAGPGVIDANVVDDGLFSANAPVGGGTVTIGGNLSGSGSLTVQAPCSLEVANADDYSGGIVLSYGAKLVLETGDAPSAPISVLYAGGMVDLAGLSYGAFLIPQYNAATGKLTIGTATLDLGVGLVKGDFSVVADGSGGTEVFISASPCFVTGTLIATPDGETPVEALRPGDLVRTHAGRVAAVRWVGWTRVELSRHPAPERATPIRICADAFGDGLPRRDLLVSPEHCLLVDGELIPAFLLTNGATIARDDSFVAVTYWHVELDRHDVLLADGLPAESYLDTGNRALFSGEVGVRALHPDLTGAPDAAALAVWAARGCAPLRLAAEDARARLRQRAEALGWRLADDPALGVLANGVALPVLATERGVCARLPAGTSRVRLLSHSFVPSEMLPGSGDVRRLGVAVSDVLLAGWPLHPDALAAGWHAAAGEAWRWTDGDALIVLPRLARPSMMELRFGCVGRYWCSPSRNVGKPRVSQASARRWQV